MFGTGGLFCADPYDLREPITYSWTCSNGCQMESTDRPDCMQLVGFSGGDLTVHAVDTDNLSASATKQVATTLFGCFTCSTAPFCGDGLVEGTEECDDGNEMPGDGCAPTCLAEDLDADGTPDFDDHCIDVSGTRALMKAKLILRGIENPTEERGAGRIRSISLSGEMRLPAGVSFASFDPSQLDGGNGMTLAIETSTMRGTWGAVLGGTYAGPGTSGWERTGSTWTFHANPAAREHGGIIKLTLGDRSASEPGRIKLTMMARNPALITPVTSTDLPLEALVVFGRSSEASAHGECGEAKFYADECKPNSSGTTVTCK
jgi:cysteine-rich repeat protein